MSTNRVSPKAGWVDAERLPKGPNGRALCRNCDTEVPKGRRTFCGDGCVDDWSVRHSPSLMRQRVFQRDKGVCAVCGVDTDRRAKELGRIHRKIVARYGPLSSAAGQFRVQHSWRFIGGRTTWWDADHIVPVIEGGGECGIDNIRTLCIPCHKAVTKELRKRMAARRRQQRFGHLGVQADLF